MYVDSMHTDAIRAADSSMLPQTVYRQGKDWYHNEAMRVKTRLSFSTVKPKIVPVVTWLPEGFFNV